MQFNQLNPFSPRNPMQKIEAELSKLTARRGQLTGKQTAAQAVLDRALEARQQHMLTGDVNDDATSQKRQAAVDSAQSALAGFGVALAVLASTITEFESKLAAERHKVACEAGSEKLTGELDDIELLLGPWLESTRDLAAKVTIIGAQQYESTLIAAYLKNTASEIEPAITAALNEMRSRVDQIRSGTFAIPKPPTAVVVPIKAASKPRTKPVFTLHAICWLEHDGVQRVLGKWHDIELPIPAAEFALAANLAVDPADPICKKSRGQSLQHPEPNWLNDLDGKTGPNVPARLRVVSDIVEPVKKLDGPGVPYVLKHREARQ
jgi:hypothetical protein